MSFASGSLPGDQHRRGYPAHRWIRQMPRVEVVPALEYPRARQSLLNRLGRRAPPSVPPVHACCTGRTRRPRRSPAGRPAARASPLSPATALKMTTSASAAASAYVAPRAAPVFDAIAAARSGLREPTTTSCVGTRAWVNPRPLFPIPITAILTYRSPLPSSPWLIGASGELMPPTIQDARPCLRGV
jgi:hypothetical protein